MQKIRKKNTFAKILLSLFLIALVVVLMKWAVPNQTPNEPTEPNASQNEQSKSPKIDLLMLVNSTHKIPNEYTPELIQSGTYAKIIDSDFQEMRATAKKEANIILFVGSAYRTYDEQAQMYKEKGSNLAQKPGYSEHETGLAIDFSYSGLSEADRNKLWNWLAENSYKYGFILRYPEGKEKITGIDYEPWHYRYVGKTHAKAIYENDYVLEEYVEVEK